MRYCVALWLTLLMLPAHAFDAQGHALICQMAYMQLSEPVRASVDALVKQSPEKNFPAACSWPDVVRDQASFRHTKPWHFVNVAHTAEKVVAADCPAHGCLLSAIPAMQERLRKNPENDWQALLFLSHFLGDLHQPMHVSFAEDRGGNMTDVRYLGSNTNLHHLFDGEILGALNYRQKTPQWLSTITPEQRLQWQQGDMLIWATESLYITRFIYQKLPATNIISEEYKAFFSEELSRQMKKASVRLAHVLEETFQPESL